MRHFYLGIDLGGSNISAAFMTAQGNLEHLEKIKTQSESGPREIVSRIIQMSEALRIKAGIQNHELTAVGIGAPGIVDVEKGMVISSPNLPGWKNIPLRRWLQAGLKKPVIIDNDANVAAYGEKWMGAGKKFQHVILYTLGTGVGGGLILDGEIYHGMRNAAGEVGHTTILPDGPVCGCGNKGCLEALTSGTAIAREAMQAMKKDSHSRLHALCQGKPEAVTAKMVFQAARLGDRTAKQIVAQTARYLGIGIANILNLLNPELVILGGGVSLAGEALLGPVRAEVKRRALKASLDSAKIVAAKLSDKAGVIGAAGVAVHAHEKLLKQGRQAKC